MSFRKFCLLMTLCQVVVFSPIVITFMIHGDEKRAVIMTVTSSICLLICLFTIGAAPKLRRLITNQPAQNRTKIS